MRETGPRGSPRAPGFRLQGLVLTTRSASGAEPRSRVASAAPQESAVFAHTVASSEAVPAHGTPLRPPPLLRKLPPASCTLPRSDCRVSQLRAAGGRGFGRLAIMSPTLKTVPGI